MKTTLNKEAFLKQLHDVDQDILAFIYAKNKYEEKLLKAKIKDINPNAIQGFKTYKMRSERAIMYAREYRKQLNMQYKQYLEDWKKELVDLNDEDTNSI